LNSKILSKVRLPFALCELIYAFCRQGALYRKLPGGYCRLTRPNDDLQLILDVFGVSGQ
jgi:hypothetical protein